MTGYEGAHGGVSGSVVVGRQVVVKEVTTTVGLNLLYCCLLATGPPPNEATTSH